MKRLLTKDELRNLRKDIKLGSLHYHDYRNRYGIDEHDVCDFFDGYWSYIESEAVEGGTIVDSMSDNQYCDVMAQYDNGDTLEEWYYYMLMETPVMIDDADDESNRYDRMSVDEMWRNVPEYIVWSDFRGGLTINYRAFITAIGDKWSDVIEELADWVSVLSDKTNYRTNLLDEFFLEYDAYWRNMNDPWCERRFVEVASDLVRDLWTYCHIIETIGV